MDVRFCEGRNHCREAHVRAAYPEIDRRARSSPARQENCCFLLTKTYMDVGYSEVIHRDESFNRGFESEFPNLSFLKSIKRKDLPLSSLNHWIVAPTVRRRLLRSCR